MALSTVVGTKRDGIVRLIDGAANSLQLTFEVGDFSFSDPRNDRVVIRSRGSINGLRDGDQPVGELSFSVHFREFTNSSAVCLMDMCYKRGSASAFTSTGGSGYEPYLVSVQYDCDKTALGDASSAVANFAKVLLVAAFSESDSDTLEITGEVYGGVTYTGI